MSDHIEINIDTGNEVDEFQDTEFHGDDTPDGEIEETSDEWTSPNETSESPVLPEAEAAGIAAAILVEEVKQTEAEQAQAEAAQVIAAAEVAQAASLNDQLAAINNQLTVIMNQLNPPVLESSASEEIAPVAEVEAVTVETVPATTPSEPKSPSGKARREKKPRKRSVKSLLRK